MNLPPLIMLAGTMGSGKSSFAKLLQWELGSQANEGYTLRAMADPLRDELREKLNTDISPFHPDFKSAIYTQKDWKGIGQFPKPEMTGGEILQWYGTDIKRKYNPLYWVCRRFADFNQVHDRWIITDGRFRNEFVACQLLNGVAIHVYSDESRIQAGDGRNAQHESETEIFEWTRWDYEVHNFGTLEDLRKEACELVNYLKKCME